MHVRKGLLFAVLAQLCRSIDRHATMPVLQHVKLDADAGALRVEATDLTTHIVATIPCEGRYSGCLPAKALSDFVKPESAPDKHSIVELLPDETGKVSVAVEGAITTLAALPAADFPRRPGDKLAVHAWRGAGTWRVKDFADALGWITRAVGTDETRKHLTGVLFESDKVIALDGHRLHLARIPGLGAVAALLPGSSILALLHLLPKSGDVAALRAKDVIRFRFATGDVQWEVETSGMTEKFPPYDQVIPADGSETYFAVVEREPLLRAVARMPKSRDRHVGIRMVVNGSIKLERDGDDGVTSTTVAVVRTTHEGADSVLGVNATYIADALACPVPVVTARFGGELDPVRIELGRDRLAVVMPMRL